MSECGTYHGALRFPRKDDALPRPLELFETIVADTLDDMGHPVFDRAFESDNTVWITALDFDLTIQQGPHRLSFTLSPTGASCKDVEMCHMLLSVILYRATVESDASSIEWLCPKTRVQRTQFLTVFDPSATPAPEEDYHPIFSSVDETAVNIDLACERIAADRRVADFEAAAEIEGPRDLSERFLCWGMTGFTALVFAPMAVVMAVVNLMNGEDFRRNAHALTVTFALIALTSGGALAGAIQLLSP